MAPIHTYYYTDPMCPWSRAIEPAGRKLSVEFADGVETTYVMCRMAREGRDAAPIVGEALEACLAVKAVSEQGDPRP